MAEKTFALEEYRTQYPGAFTATDLTAAMVFPGGQQRHLGSMAAISVSTHRDTFPVTSTYSVEARGFTRGHRIVAGTMLFHTVDRAAIQGVGDVGNPIWTSDSRKHWGRSLPDQLPLFDVYLTYVNEQGMLSMERIYGIAIQDFGKTISLENLTPLEQYSYMALDYAPLQSVHAAAPQPVKLQPTPTQRRAPRVYGETDTYYGLPELPEEVAGYGTDQLGRELNRYFARRRGV